MSLLVLLALLTGDAAENSGRDVPQASVGMPLRLEQVVLPGPQLEATPWTDRRQKLVVRIVDVYPHGNAFRYDLECVGYEPGDYDLREHLLRQGRTAVEELPPIPVRIVTLLPPGQIEPHALARQPVPWLGGYRLLLCVLGSVWAIGLLALLAGYRKRNAQGALGAKAPLTLAQRLQPLLERAQRGELTIAEQAEIERLLLAYWRQRLDLDEAHPLAAISALRVHPEAGELLRRLESWLHDPHASREMDLSALLAPYRDGALEPRQQAEIAGVSG